MMECELSLQQLIVFFPGDHTISTVSMEENERVPSIFNPDHPYAFTPPDYDSLSKDPPAYMELFGMGDNTGFIGDDEGSRPQTPAPPYSENDESQVETGSTELSTHRQQTQSNTTHLSRANSVKSTSNNTKLSPNALHRVHQGLGLVRSQSLSSSHGIAMDVSLPGHVRDSSDPLTVVSVSSADDNSSVESSNSNNSNSCRLPVDDEASGQNIVFNP